jgi:hypothetical protein
MAAFDVELGDELNGIVAERNFKSSQIDQIATWMIAEAIRLWPGSDLAKGRNS